MNIIYAAKLPIEKYSKVNPAGNSYGLYDTYYQSDPDLLALIMISSLVPFAWEIPGGDAGSLPAEVTDKDGSCEKALDFQVSGQSIRAIITSYDPLDSHRIVSEGSMDGYPLMPNGQAAKDLFSVRATAWGLGKYRGVTKVAGNVVQASFGGRDPRVTEDMMTLYNLVIKGVMENGKSK